jgi:hypothetical protein
MATLRYVHRPELPRPFIHILEDVPMDRLEVRDIECAFHGSVDQLRDAAMRSTRFESSQQLRISETAQIS